MPGQVHFVGDDGPHLITASVGSNFSSHKNVSKMFCSILLIQKNNFNRGQEAALHLKICNFHLFIHLQVCNYTLIKYISTFSTQADGDLAP